MERANSKEYYEEHTKDWELLDKNNEIELWSYFDEVEWCNKKAIKYNDYISVEFDNSEDYYSYFNFACML